MKRILPHLAFVLVGLQLLLMLVSWLLSAAFPASQFRSLLTGEGLRWFMGSYARLVATPVLAWLLLGAMAYGCLWRSGLLHRPSSYREHRALMISLLLMAAIVVVMLLFTVVPHAVLLSAVGGLWPSPFSDSLIPVVAFSVTLVSAVYGLVVGRFEGVADVYHAVLQGIRLCAPLLLFYVLLIQIYESLRFMLS
jgi:aminobenzoyl-glutamate transport protein